MSDVNTDKIVEKLALLAKQKRKELKLTQGVIGERMGKPQSTVARFESGNVKDPHISLILQIADALGINPGDFINEAYEQAGSGLSTKEKAEKQLQDLTVWLEGLNDSQKESVTSLINGIRKLL